MSNLIQNTTLNRFNSIQPSGYAINNSSSPLQIFNQARQSINSIYTNFSSIITEINAFFECIFI